MEQLTYLLFLERLDEIHAREEARERRDPSPARRIFPPVPVRAGGILGTP